MSRGVVFKRFVKRKCMRNSNEQDQGKLGIYYLKQIWSSVILQKRGLQGGEAQLNSNYISAVFDSVGVGLEPTYQYLFQESPSFNEFEDWILEKGNISTEMIEQFNSAISSSNQTIENIKVEDQVLDDESLRHWEEEGYIVISNVISKEDCNMSVKAIHDFLGIDPNDKSTWYHDHSLKQGIMVQLFHHPQLDKNRFSKKIRKIYQQLWKRNDLIVSKDRVSFNPPENERFTFPGPDLHWDVSLKRPIPFGIQGLLYLTDTDANQGAFTLVPGFHRKIESWLENLSKNVDPRKCDLHQLGAKPIAASAGDFIIWNQMLPHGSSPNSGTKPRIVQYINYQSLTREIESIWI